MTRRTLLLIVLMPLAGLAGFAAGAVIAMVLGTTLHDNYEYFSPGDGPDWVAKTVGAVLVYGGALIGLTLPWIVAAFGRRK